MSLLSEMVSFAGSHEIDHFVQDMKVLKNPIE
jgi:hypothetical protein